MTAQFSVFYNGTNFIRPTWCLRSAESSIRCLQLPGKHGLKLSGGLPVERSVLINPL